LSTLSRLKVVSSEDKACRDSWCLKCRNFLQKTVQRAENLNSRVLSSCLSRGCVEIECEHMHKFTVNYTKNHSKTWCEECKNEQNKQRQQQWENRAKAEEHRKQQEQKRLFEESLRHMQEQQKQQEQQFASQQEATYFEESLKHIVFHAKRKMEKEMSSSEFHGECNHVEIFNVYKILYMPLNLLIKTLTMIDRSQLSSQYRQLALLLHPDKNKHKLANEAFLKLSQAYEMCKRLI
jgi:flagellar biosynthesis GTPase FlhF